MKRLCAPVVFAMFACAAALVACGGGERRSEVPGYNPYVEAFTSGSIPRTAPVTIVFSDPVDSALMTPQYAAKHVKIRPSVEGAFSFADARTLVFRPAGELSRGTAYTVTADIAAFFDAGGGDREFSFTFSTLPLVLRANMESLDINEENTDNYDIGVTVNTPDAEPAAVVESLVTLPRGAAAGWTHSGDGRSHYLKLMNVAPGDAPGTITLAVGANSHNVERGDLLTVYVPARDAFAVYDVRYVSSPEKYVEAVFTKALDGSQSMQGLARIEGNRNTTVSVEGNKLRLYPDAGRTGNVEVWLEEGIRSAAGVRLGRQVRRTVAVSGEQPSVEFIGDGVIVPQSSQLAIPFRAVWLRGVVVRVIRIMENNVGQFLQTNDLDGGSELMRVGRLVARKTIWLDEQGADPGVPGTYAVDLRQIIDPEPGAVYRVELSFDRDLSAWPCDGFTPRPKEQINAQDAVKMAEELSRYDAGGYYYWDDYDWSDYRYDERNDPCTNSFYLTHDTRAGRNVLATDLGVIAKMGGDDRATVLVHNLLSARPEQDVEVTLYNFQHQRVGSGTTDERGEVHVNTTGRPYYLRAVSGRQHTWLQMAAGSALSTSAFDVAGEVVQKGLKGFIYGDRGVWRPGDTMYLSFMLGDRKQTLPADMPVVMELYNPLGQLYLRKTQTRGELGLYAFEMPTEADAPTGAWNVRVTVGGVAFDKRVRVESIKPNRLKIDLRFDGGMLAAGRAAAGTMHVEWLQGAVARNLRYEIDGTFTRAATKFARFDGFTFDDPAKRFVAEEIRVASGTTDAEGNAAVATGVDVGSSAPGMLTANLVTRVYEESGDFSLDGISVPYSPYAEYVGIRSPQKDKARLNTGSQYTFDVAVADRDGNPVAGREVAVEIYKVNWYWWWSSDNGSLANWVSDRSHTPAGRRSVVTGADGRASFTLSYGDDDWGTYYVRAVDRRGGHSTGVMSYFDWPGSSRRDTEGAEGATELTFKTDKETYRPGERISFTIPSSAGSRAVVSVENGTKVLSIGEFECGRGETTIRIDATEEMQPNAYLNVTLLQPHALTGNDLPIRMYGVVPVTVTSAESYLHPEIKVADELKPEAQYEVTVSEKDGREMAYTLAIVDEGLLDLTRFATPDPWRAFNAREALGVATWDMYDHVVGAYGGRIEQLFSIGGDDEAGAAGPKAIVNRFKPVVQFAGPFVLKRGERRKHTYTMPAYNGRVRVMVVAGDGGAYGSAEKSVMVRKPVMVLGTLPRVIGVGEEMVVPSTVFATVAGVGAVNVAISCSDNMQIVGPASQTLNFTEPTDKQATFRVRTGAAPGAGRVTITATGRGERSTWETDIEIRSVRRKQVVTTSAVVEAGKRWSGEVALPGASGTNTVGIEVSDVPPVNLGSRLAFLLGYPHGCVEQITSKAFPQLYVDKFATLTGAQKQAADEAVKETLRRYRSYQTAGGAFSYWPGGTDANAWATIYAVHFMTEAAARGYLVPEQVLAAAMANLRTVARSWHRENNQYAGSEELTQAYRLYVLALAGTPELGAMNRLRENRSLSSAAAWMLAAAYARAGRQDVATAIVTATKPLGDTYNAQWDLTYGSDTRDRAVRLMTLTMTGNAAEAAALSREISEALSSGEWMSTQTTAFALLAVSQYATRYAVAENMEFSYSVGAAGERVNTVSHVWSADAGSVGGRSVATAVDNRGKSTLFARIVAEGVPDQGAEEEYANGITITVSYEDAAGRSVDVASLAQGTNLRAVVAVRNPTSRGVRNLVLTQVFPAGWEILETRFMNDGAADRNAAGVNYRDVRDDRVYSYIDYLPPGRQITVRLNLAAVYRGRFYLPPVWCEAMYDNTVRANTAGREVTVE